MESLRWRMWFIEKIRNSFFIIIIAKRTFRWHVQVAIQSVSYSVDLQWREKVGGGTLFLLLSLLRRVFLLLFLKVDLHNRIAIFPPLNSAI